MKGLISLAFLLLVSCVSIERATANRLAGEWLYADKSQSCRYIFKKDGTFNGEVLVRAKLISKFTGRWSVEDRTLSYRYEKDLLGKIPPGALDHDSCGRRATPGRSRRNRSHRHMLTRAQ